MTTNCEAEVREKIQPATSDRAWRQCFNAAIKEHDGAQLCLVHLGIAVSGRPLQLVDGRAVIRGKVVTSNG